MSRSHTIRWASIVPELRIRIALWPLLCRVATAPVVPCSQADAEEDGDEDEDDDCVGDGEEAGAWKVLVSRNSECFSTCRDNVPARLNPRKPLITPTNMIAGPRKRWIFPKIVFRCSRLKILW